MWEKCGFHYTLINFSHKCSKKCGEIITVFLSVFKANEIPRVDLNNYVLRLAPEVNI